MGGTTELMVEMANKTLFETLGAELGIRTVVDDFYDRVVADPSLAHYFTSVDMSALRRHQVDFLSAATGGPKQYDGHDLAQAHAPLGVTDSAFNAVVGHLIASLEACDVAPDTISTVVSALAPLRSDIVSSD